MLATKVSWFAGLTASRKMKYVAGSAEKAQPPRERIFLKPDICWNNSHCSWMWLTSMAYVPVVTTPNAKWMCVYGVTSIAVIFMFKHGRSKL